MITQLATWALFAVALAVAVGVLVATIRPEVQRIQAILRWRRHDRRVGLARDARAAQ